MSTEDDGGGVCPDCGIDVLETCIECGRDYEQKLTEEQTRKIMSIVISNIEVADPCGKLVELRIPTPEDMPSFEVYYLQTKISEMLNDTGETDGPDKPKV